jgi:quercetin dioxygenase-like cupin family protein
MQPNWVFNLNDKTAGISRKLAEGIQTRIFSGQQAMISVVDFDPHAKGVLHHHPQEQWGVLLRGSLTRIQGDDRVEMRAGDFWLTPGGVAHTIHAGEQGATVLDIFSPIRSDYQQPGEGFGQAEQPADH